MDNIYAGIVCSPSKVTLVRVLEFVHLTGYLGSVLIAPLTSWGVKKLDPSAIGSIPIKVMGEANPGTWFSKTRKNTKIEVRSWLWDSESSRSSCYIGGGEFLCVFSPPISIWRLYGSKFD